MDIHIVHTIYMYCTIGPPILKSFQFCTTRPCHLEVSRVILGLIDTEMIRTGFLHYC